MENSQKSFEDNRIYKKMMQLWGEENCEAIVSTRGHNEKIKVNFKQLLAQTPLSSTERQLLSNISNADLNQVLIAGRVMGIGDGLQILANEIQNNYEAGKISEELFGAFYGYIMVLYLFNWKTMKLAEESSNILQLSMKEMLKDM